MNEQLIHPENKPEHFEAKEHEPHKKEHHKERAEVSGEKLDVAELHKAAIEKAVSAKEISVGEHKETTQHSPAMVQKELKADAFNRTLIKVRRQLNPVDRVFSKLVHQPVIDAVSEFSGKTIARPSGLLGGGLFALIGSSLLLYISKHYGFEYNFTVFLIMFAGGFAAGLFAELAMKLAKNN